MRRILRFLAAAVAFVLAPILFVETGDAQPLETAFYAPMVSDWRNFETWQESGGLSATQRAHAIWKQLLAVNMARREVMVELQTLMQEEGPIVQPLWRAIFTAMDKRVQGFAMHPTNYLFANEWALGS